MLNKNFNIQYKIIVVLNKINTVLNLKNIYIFLLINLLIYEEDYTSSYILNKFREYDVIYILIYVHLYINIVFFIYFNIYIFKYILLHFLQSL